MQVLTHVSSLLSCSNISVLQKGLLPALKSPMICIHSLFAKHLSSGSWGSKRATKTFTKIPIPFYTILLYHIFLKDDYPHVLSTNVQPRFWDDDNIKVEAGQFGWRGRQGLNGTYALHVPLFLLLPSLPLLPLHSCDLGHVFVTCA